MRLLETRAGGPLKQIHRIPVDAQVRAHAVLQHRVCRAVLDSVWWQDDESGVRLPEWVDRLLSSLFQVCGAVLVPDGKICTARVLVSLAQVRVLAH